MENKQLNKKSKAIFVNGIFDILHPGHIGLLKFAKSLGDKLIVGINSDRVTKILKGEERPINNQENRKIVLESLDSVDEVVIFDDVRIGNIVRQLKPDVLVQGGEHTVEGIRQLDDIPPEVEIKLFPMVGSFSTTNVIKKIREETTSSSKNPKCKLDIIKSFEKKKILLIGDTILDVNSYSHAVCKALDAPTTEAEQNDVAISFGGASLVAANILELGGSLVYFSVIGNDENARYYDSFTHPKLDKYLLVDNNRKTTVKRKFWVDGYKLLQINEVDNQYIETSLEKKFMELTEHYVSGVDLIVIADAQHGLLTKGLINHLIQLSKKYQKPLYVDTQISHRNSNHHLYQGVNCILFNQREAQVVNPDFDINQPEYSLNSIREKLGIANVVVKLGKQGSIALFNGQYIKNSPYQAVTVDACGAGDAFLAAFSLGGLSDPELIVEILDIANIWAALSTTIYGTMPPKKQNLINICHV